MTDAASALAAAMRSIPIAADVLSMSVTLSVKKGLFGSLKPTPDQLGWSYGFCDAWAQAIPLTSDEEFIFFISAVFESVFGRSGRKYFLDIAKNQHKYISAMVSGGNAHNDWVINGKSPLMPLAY